MAKDYVDQREAKSLRSAPTRRNVGNGEDRRRTQPADQGPYSVAEIAKLYKRDDHSPFHNVKAGDGLVDAKQHEYDTMIQKPQFPEDQHDNSRHGRYRNDVADGWIRGSGLRGAESKPSFDRVRSGTRYDKPAKGPRNSASGADGRSSPFSSAHFKGRGER